MSESIDLEREKNKSYELGITSGIETVASELRERAGEEYASASNRREHERAKLLKELADEYDEMSEERKDEWRDKYKGDGDD